MAYRRCQRPAGAAGSPPTRGRPRSGAGRPLAAIAAAIVAALLAAACGAPAAGGKQLAAPSPGSSPAPAGVATTGPATTGPATTGPATTGPATTGPATTGPGATSPAPGPAAAKPLAGKIVGIDPGHNGRNGTDPVYLNHLIWNGRSQETCDTTGTETDGGYTEATFNFNVAGYLRADLRQDGARVVLTRTSNDGVGPCVDRRAQLINDSGANVAVDIHADGGPPGGRGFTVLEPVADGPNDKVISSSARLGRDVRAAFLTLTPMPASDYYGHDGLILRDDLAGLNLTRVPKILIECGNMRNATDAQLLTSVRVQRLIARALLAAIIRFLR